MTDQNENWEDIQTHVWVDPPDRTLPIRGQEVRFSVGFPTAMSTNSWKVEVRKHDVYVYCRDNFREIKVSLHASGNWRLGFTATAIAKNPHILSPGQDRAWTKWRPQLEDRDSIIAFQLVVPHESLYLEPERRSGWPKDIVFVEPPRDPCKIAVISVVVAKTMQPLGFDINTHGFVLGIIPFRESWSIQVVVIHENREPFAKVLNPSLQQAVDKIGENVNLNYVLVLSGVRAENIPWIVALRLREIFQS
jgi:hypothetical protein